MWSYAFIVIVIAALTQVGTFAAGAATTGSTSTSYGCLDDSRPCNQTPSSRTPGVVNLVVNLSGGGADEEEDGGNSDEEPDTASLNNGSSDSVNRDVDSAEEHTADKGAEQEAPPERVSLPRKENSRQVHASHVISSISDHGLEQESLELRKLIATRAHEYLEDTKYGNKKHPKKLLHHIASRIPAIKQSPDSMLKITSARPDVDAGVAAFAIGTIARICEMCAQEDDSGIAENVASDVMSDRRFEQLVECILCGVDMRKRKRQQKEAEAAEKAALERKGDKNQQVDVEGQDEEDFADEVVQVRQGVSAQDACRAAWGMAILLTGEGQSRLDESIGGENTSDILMALSSRSRDMLLARLQRIRGSVHVAAPTRVELEHESKRLAKDAAIAMWAFACVDACTGIKSYSLFHTCCSILCQVPTTHKNVEEGLDDSNFEVSDVVERLAKSETESIPQEAYDVDSRKAPRQEEGTNVMTDVLMDSLSPNEVTDVLWSVALHGAATDDTHAKSDTVIASFREEGQSLSETAGALREVAFDRLVAWLRQDLAVIQESAAHTQHERNTSVKHAQILEEGGGKTVAGSLSTAATTTVEVVDAATLLAVETETPAPIAASTAEHLTLSYDDEEVQVVDAATLLASSVGEDSEANLESGAVLTSPPGSCQVNDEAVSAETGHFETMNVDVVDTAKAPHSLRLEEEKEIDKNDSNFAGESPLSNMLLFSAHDLCSIAWAVTDLRDPLRFLIVDLVVQIVEKMGPQGTQDLLSFDKSNLVWAIARCSTVTRGNRDDTEKMNATRTPALMVTKWIAEATLADLGLQDLGKIDNEFNAQLSRVLEAFHPMELSRLMWSMACVANSLGDRLQKDTAMCKLALIALCTAGSNLAMFTTEDLARIAWAFLELCDTNQFTSRTFIAEAFGRIVATMEASLLRWESGQCSSSSLEEKLKSTESTRFTTFFGKPRLSRFIRPLLEQRLGDYEDDEEEATERFPASETRSLPLLRDLTIDPSTLCKVASGLCRFAQEHHYIGGMWNVVRVAVRLLTSKNGQLLKECNIHDVVRLSNACATIQGLGGGEDRELIMRMVARRTVQLLNESFESQQKMKLPASPLLAKAAPWEICLLYWSLGELGVRHIAKDENRGLAHRKLRLVSEKHLIKTDQLDSLPFSSLVQLVQGIVSTNAVSIDKQFLRRLLSTMLSKVKGSTRFDELCQASESIARIRHSLGPLDSTASHHVSNDSPKVVGGGPKHGDGIQTDTEDNQMVDGALEKREENVIARLTNSTTTDQDIFALCDEILVATAEVAMDRLKDCTAAEMQRLLLVYSVLPVQVDAVVDAIENEIESRLEALELATSMSEGTSIQKLVRSAADNTVEACNSLSTSGDDSSATSIKNGLKSFFSSPHKADEAKPQVHEEELLQGERLSDLVNRAAASSCEAAARVERVERGAQVSAETTLRSVEEAAAFELGRCQELVASYRRIDFDSRTRQSRYDDGRKDVGKRVLSRLLPHDSGN